ncbi:protein NDR1-like [Cynara cardunculus var. scolymus]|uniref:protein NDR1-like n=1 Tax=Cynara cardunculus var. scolymus TaxID=59895 RepID=UPI000D62F398|nr:protein NDR1-like [Cynara cardunculus var. scolymus]
MSDDTDGVAACVAVSCCCMSSIGLPLMFFLIPLYTNPHNPAFSVQKFYVPAFNKTANNSTSSTIAFNIKLQNQNTAIGLYYDHSVNLTIAYTSKQTNDEFIWQYSVPKFYQGNAQSRRLVDEIQMVGENVAVWNQTVVAENAWTPRSRAMMTRLEPLQLFRVDIATKVRFKLVGNHGKLLVVSALVPVNPNSGELYTKHGIMTSVASRIGWSSGGQVVVLLVSTVISIIFVYDL